MSPTEAIIFLALVGFLLLAAEVFVPGLVLGIFGGLCLCAAVAVAFAAFGPVTGSIVFAGIFAATLVGFVIWMFVFPHTTVGRKLMLKTTLTRGEGERAPRSRLLGQEGRAITPLRPSGSALIASRKVDVVAESDFIAPEEPVVVVHEEGPRIVVRKKV